MEEFTSTNEGKSRMDFPGGLTLQGIAGIAAIALAIVGLCGVAPVLIMSITSIFLGLALLMSAWNVGIGTGYSGMVSDVDTGVAEEGAGGSMGFSALAGLAGVVVGILSLIGISPGILLPAAAIAFGCATLLESTSFAPSRNAPFPVSGASFLCGAAAVVLGILALSGYNLGVLTFIAFLTIGCANLLSGTSLFQSTTAALHRRF